ncbi:4'-phosphopantetheinyl transferase family protein [Musicola keenii]|uniref:4'-phosphopantetheinyl transferase family protein n=1 Tax=Musicola keenii TaxID=2884250 RepID=UPI00177CF700|nr:4'-phosphopantetheinyl transferase superfamily protein [Musicola keenii]
MRKDVSSISSCRWDELPSDEPHQPLCIVAPVDSLASAARQAAIRQAAGVDIDTAMTLSQQAWGILRLLLAPICRQVPQALRFERNAHGKPFLVDYPAIQFNVSHTRTALAFAIAMHHPVGVDVERCVGNPTGKRAVAARFFHPNETHWLASLSDEAFLPAFIRLWTRKEAYIKALGLGLHRQLNDFSCLSAAGHVLVRDKDQDVDAVIQEGWLDGAPATAFCCCALPTASAVVDIGAWRVRILTPDAG